MVAQRSALAQALDAHRQGRLPQAESQYLQILSTDALPDAVDADARHWLGVLRLQQNRPADARLCFEQALARVPTHDAARLNLGHALRQIGDIAGAHAAFAQAAKAASSEVATAAMIAWAQALAATGEHAQALQLFDRALTQAGVGPGVGSSVNSGERAPGATIASGRHGPGQALLHEGRGIALAALGRHADAEHAHRAALALRPQHAGTHNNLGLAVKAQGRLDDAIWHFRDALRINPSFVPALVNLGQSVALTGDYDQATAPLQRAVDLAPDFAPAHHELANALAALGRYDDAARHFQRAVDRDPRSALGWQNLGAVRFEMGQLDAAMTALDRALSLNPRLALARFNRASLLLAAHPGREGWLAYEARHQVWRSPRTFDGIVRWYGDPAPVVDQVGLAAPSSFALTGKTILLHAEQGFGDTLQFLRFVGAVAARAGRVILEVPAALLPVVAPAVAVRAPSVVTIAAGHPAGHPAGHSRLATIDCHCPLASLPLALGVSALPAPQAWPLPYIDAPGNASIPSLPAGNQADAAGAISTSSTSPAAASTSAPPSASSSASPSMFPSFASRLASGVTARLRRATPTAFATSPAAPRLPLKIGIAWSGRRAQFTIANVVDTEGVANASTRRNATAAANAVAGSDAADAVDAVDASNARDLNDMADGSDAPRPFDKRAIPLDMLMPLFALPHVEWHVMQTDIEAADRDVLAQLLQTHPVVHRSLAFKDFGDTANALAELDHLVSIDTSVAHLAGAMARPVTLLLPLAADWRWSACDAVTGASAWYPSVQPVRQRYRGDWSGPVQQAAEIVMGLVGSALKAASSPSASPVSAVSRKRR